MEQVNMKGKGEPLAYFRRAKVDDKEVFIYLKEEDVMKFSLNSFAEDLPLMEGQFTMVNNYFIYYWQPFLKQGAFSLYITLKSFCYGEKDYCFPSISRTLTAHSGQSVTTIRKNLNLLEEYGFIFRFYTHSENKEKSGEMTPIIKIRKNCPLLPNELIEKLPKPLRVKHDEFMEKYQNNNMLRAYMKPNFEGEYNDFLYNKGELRVANTHKEIIAVNDRYELRKSTTSEHDLALWNKIKTELLNELASPSERESLERSLLESDQEKRFFTIWCSTSTTYKILYERYEKDIVRLLKKHLGKNDIRVAYDLYAVDVKPPKVDDNDLPF